MKIRFILIAVCFLFSLPGQADEGMWMLGNLNKQTRQTMKELGLQMSVNKLYNTKRPSLKDAVVSFGGFCSGVVVSGDGLVFTNHHCGFSSIQQHSSVEHDYLKDGFVARNLSEELPNPELYVRFLLHQQDVTRRVLGAVKPDMNESERTSVVDSVMLVIGEEVSRKDSTLIGIVDAYYGGNEFWFIATTMMCVWYLHPLLQWASSAGTLTTGYGRAIRVTSPYSVSMPAKTTVLPTILPTMFPTIPNTWLRYLWTVIVRVPSV